MQQFIEKYQEEILGTLSGFDRLVFRAAPRRLNTFKWDPIRKVMVGKGMEEYLWQNKIKFTDFGTHVKRVSDRIKNEFLKRFAALKLPIEYLRDAQVEKDQRARELAAKHGIQEGLICAFTAMELYGLMTSFTHGLMTSFTRTGEDGCRGAYRGVEAKRRERTETGICGSSQKWCRRDQGVM